MAKPEKKPSFVHAVDIAAAPDAVWRALTDGALTAQYWNGWRVASNWKVGSAVTFWYRRKDGEEAVGDRGIVLECRAPKRLSYTWHVEFSEEMRDELPSRVTFDLSEHDGATRLTVTHDDLEVGGTVVEAVRAGWPVILGNLKTLLETDA
jgi:uncharacterized protein YndB with AHSA1/START domain